MTNRKQHVFKKDGFLGSVDHSLEDDCLHGRLLHIPDLVTYQGSTVSELREAFEEAVADYILDCAEDGHEPVRSCSGTFNVRIGPDRHKNLAVEAAEKGVNLNTLVCSIVDEHFTRAVSPDTQASTLARRAGGGVSTGAGGLGLGLGHITPSAHGE